MSTTTTTTTTISPVRRPLLLSVVTVLMIIGGALQVLAGLVTVTLNSNTNFQDNSGEARSTLLILGTMGIAFGVVNIWFAVLLRRGSRFARTVVAIFEVLQLGGAVWTVIALHSQYRINAVITIAISLFVIWYLYGNERSRAFFGDPA